MDKILSSVQDNSINIISEKSVGFTEARYVRREKDYFIIYLSSQTGCGKRCKFCHLTASGQTKFIHVNREDYLSQATSVMNEYNKLKNSEGAARVVHYNWMSRGEALSNPYLINEAYPILSDLTNLSISNSLIPKFNISTIMPYEVSRKELSEIFLGITPTLYYSLYSMNKDFRKVWMPSAIDPNKALEKLKRYQDDSKKIIKIHYAFIKDENDSLEDLKQVCDAISTHDLKVEFNLVRYNPYSSEEGEESSEEVLNRNLEFLKDNLDSKVKMIKRVGFDIKASCGMFIEN